MRNLVKSLSALFILLLVCSCTGSSSDPATIARNDSIAKNDSIIKAKVHPVHSKVQEMVDSINAALKKDQSNIIIDKTLGSVKIDADTLCFKIEIMGKGDINMIKGVINDKDVRDMIFGNLIASAFTEKPSKKDIKNKTSMKLLMEEVLAEKMHLSLKLVTIYGTAKGTYSPEEIVAFRDKYKHVPNRFN